MALIYSCIYKKLYIRLHINKILFIGIYIYIFIYILLCSPWILSYKSRAERGESFAQAAVHALVNLDLEGILELEDTRERYRRDLCVGTHTHTYGLLYSIPSAQLLGKSRTIFWIKRFFFFQNKSHRSCFFIKIYLHVCKILDNVFMNNIYPEWCRKVRFVPP